MDVDAGQLRTRVTLQKPLRLPNVLGEIPLDQDGDWQDVADVWAYVKPLRSAEIARTRQLQLDTTHAVTIRYFPNLTADWRLKWVQLAGGEAVTRILNIAGVVDPDDHHVLHELACVETTGG